MLIRYVLLSALGDGGTIRTTWTMAATLRAMGHQVEVVTVVRGRDRPKLPVDRKVRLVTLVDNRPATLEKRKRTLRNRAVPLRRRLLGEARRRRDDALRARPSRVFPDDEFAFGSVNRLTDRRLRRYLEGLSGGVVVGTRPGINIAIARYAPPDVLRVGQEHLNRQSLKPQVQAQTLVDYPALDLLATLTEQDADTYRAVLPAVPPVVAVPNAVPDTGGHLSPLTVPRVIAAGRVTKQKAFWRLIEAFALVADEFPEWRLDIYGRAVADVRDRWQQRIDDHQLGDRVRFAGFTRRLHEEMAASSIFAMSSLFEGFPMVMLEAMQIGLPVISFDFPTGPRELIDPGGNGLLIPDKDIEALAEGLRTLMRDDELRRRMGEAGRQTAARYQPTIIARRWVELFEQAMRAKAGEAAPARPVAGAAEQAAEPAS